MSSTALQAAPHAGGGILPTTFEQATAFAERVARSGFIPGPYRGKPDDVLACVIVGHELGIGPMQALRAIHVVNGKPILSADLMVGLVKRSPECEYLRIVESTDERAVYETKRRGEPEPTRLDWTFEQAKRAGLTNNPTWKKHTAAMLRARCASALARAVYPDLVMGIYEEDEGREISSGNGQRRQNATPELAPEPPAAISGDGSSREAGVRPADVQEATFADVIDSAPPVAPIEPGPADADYAARTAKLAAARIGPSGWENFYTRAQAEIADWPDEHKAAATDALKEHKDRIVVEAQETVQAFLNDAEGRYMNGTAKAELAAELAEVVATWPARWASQALDRLHEDLTAGEQVPA